MILDIISSALGFVGPPIFDFLKKKFLSPKVDTPEATLSSLATTKPELMGDFVDSQAKLFEAKSKFFNRDVIGEISFWVRDLRSIIRPLFVIYTIVYTIIATKYGWHTDQYIKTIMEINATSWFSSRFL